MKPTHVLVLSFLLLPLTGAVAQGVKQVKDKSKNKQLEREVFIKWDKDDFDPKWYYILFHNKYRRGEDKRNMLQLAPTIAALRLNKSDAEQEEEDVNTVYEQEMFKAADRTLNKNFYLLYERKIVALNRQIATLNAEAVAAGVEFDMLLALVEEHDRIKADIELTKEAYQDDAKKGDRFRVALEDLQTLRGYYQRLILLFKTSNKLLTK